MCIENSKIWNRVTDLIRKDFDATEVHNYKYITTKTKLKLRRRN